MAYKSNLRARLAQEEEQRAKEAADLEAHPEQKIIKKSTALRNRPDTEKRSKFVSAAIEPTRWNEFTAINKKIGLTNNGAINMLIAKHILENRALLEEGWKR